MARPMLKQNQKAPIRALQNLINQLKKPMNIARYSPNSLKGFDALFGDTFAGLSPFSRIASFFDKSLSENRGIAADLYEDENSYYVRLEMPGVNKEEVNVQLNGDTLSVSFDRVVKDNGKGESRTSYHRMLTAPKGADGGKISAALNDGILTVTMPKAEEVKPRTIKVD